MEIRHKITAFFWAFLFLAILLQLSTSEEIPFGTALLYALSVLATFRLYFHYAARLAVKRLVAKLHPAAQLLLLLMACTALALGLAAQGYVLAKLTLPAASARLVLSNSLPTFFGLFILSGFIASLNYLFEKYQESLVQEKELEVLKRKALEMELNALRNQLSPHFTFNVLNNLHFLIYKDKNEALALLATYSKILRYYVYESRKESIAFGQEVAFIHEYFAFQCKQRPARLEIVFNSAVHPEGFCIVPFILTTFVENAFKHVMPNKAEEYYVRQAHSLTQDGQLRFKISNTCGEAPAAAEYSGLGLRHVQETLTAAYPNCHQLHLRQEQGLFTVELEITLKKC